MAREIKELVKFDEIHSVVFSALLSIDDNGPYLKKADFATKAIFDFLHICAVGEERRFATKKILVAPKDFKPRRDDLALAFWNPNWEASSGSERYPIEVQLTRIIKLVKNNPIDYVTYQHVPLGLIPYASYKLLFDKNNQGVNPGRAYVDSDIFIPIRRQDNSDRKVAAC